MDKQLILKAFTPDRNNYLKCFEQVSKRFTESEAHVLALHHSGRVIRQATDQELNLVIVPATLLSICSITGWRIPYGEVLTQLNRNFYCKLKEDYFSLTMAEIDYAFRNSNVENFGKEIAINLIAKVLDEFMNRRAELRQQQEKNKSIEIDFTSQERTREDLQSSYDFWKKEIIGGISIDYIPSSLFETICDIAKVEPTNYGITQGLNVAKGFYKAEYSKMLANSQTNKETGEVIRIGQYNEVKKSLDILKDEKTDNWKFLPDIQRRAKAHFCIDHFKKSNEYTDLKFVFVSHITKSSKHVRRTKK